MAIWFTADTHFNHPEIIGYSGRPFASAEEMDETMVQRWNDAVHPGDTVYHLGDFALTWGRDDTDLVDALLGRLNGTKHLISGNHDRQEVCKSRGWAKVSPYHEIKVDTGEQAKQRIVMCHYSLRVWNGMRKGAWMLFGHSHGNLIDIGGKTMDVGVDCHHYAPVSLSTIREFMAARRIDLHQDG